MASASFSRTFNVSVLLASLVLASMMGGCVDGDFTGAQAALREERAGLLAELNRVAAERDGAKRDLANASGDAARLAQELAIAKSSLQTRDREVERAQDERAGLLSAITQVRMERDGAREMWRGEEQNATRLREDLARLMEEGSTPALRQAQGELEVVRENLKEANSKYQAALNRDYRSLTTVSAGNVTWHFTDLRGDTTSWTYRLDSYRFYVKESRPTDHLQLETPLGKTLTVPDPRPYVTPEFFTNVVADLTEGRSDKSFVREAFNFKRQLVVYNFSLVDEKGFYKYPAETMTEGNGICGDTTILLASLLLAGNKAANYGYTVSIWIVDLDPVANRVVEDAESINHALIEVTYKDGVTQYIETTSRDFVTYDRMWGWSFDLPSS